MLISGEYTIDEQNMRDGELDSLVTFRVVTYEGYVDGKPNDKTFEEFQKEFEQLLAKYAI